MNIDHEVQAAGLRQDKMRTILAEWKSVAESRIQNNSTGLWKEEVDRMILKKIVLII